MDILKNIAGFGGRTAANVARGAADIPNALLGLLPYGGRQLEQHIKGEEVTPMFPGGKELTEQVIKPIARRTIGEEQLESPNFLDEIVQRVAYGLPSQALIGAVTGGAALAPRAIAGALAGSAGIQGAQELDLPLPLQLAAGIGSEALFNKGLSKLNKIDQFNPRSLQNIAKEAKEKYYGNIEGPFGESIKIDASNLPKKLNSLATKIGDDTSLSDSIQKQLVKNIESYKADVTSGKLSGSSAFKRRSQLNDLIRETRGNEQKYYKAIKKELIPYIEEMKSASSSFKSNLEKGDAVLRAVEFPKTFKEALSISPKLDKVLQNPIAYSIAAAGPTLWLSGGDPIKALGSSIAGYAGAKLVGKGAEIAGFISNPVNQKLLMQASKNVVQDNIPAATKYYAQLNQRANSYEKKQGDKNKILKDFEKNIKQKDRPRREKRVSYL